MCSKWLSGLTPLGLGAGMSKGVVETCRGPFKKPWAVGWGLGAGVSKGVIETCRGPFKKALGR